MKILKFPATKRERDLLRMRKQLRIERKPDRIDCKILGILIKQQQE